ncbi:MAG TPA: 3'-5' exonuclease [Rhizomicrobium sp.]|jgi:DNA polymerase III epsilon subunit-like protein|nr:3'-5' exonuclease [Rhizomicrobium sp.]
MTPAILFDLEFTAWDGSMRHHWLRPGEFKEVVQIGAVKLDPRTLEVLDTFDVLVRPRINPAISPYLEKLTGITNDTLLAKGRDFVPAYADFLAFAGDGILSAFGRDDFVFEENERLYGLGATPRPEFRDARPWFRANGFETHGLHSCDIGPRLGVPFEGQKHNALADSRSVAAGMRVLVQRGAKSLFV